MYAKSPGAVTFDEDETWRINRVQVAIILGIPLKVVDEMPITDVDDVLQVNRANEEIKAWYANQR